MMQNEHNFYTWLLAASLSACVRAKGYGGICSSLHSDVKEGISKTHRDMKLNCPRALIIATAAAKPKKEMELAGMV